MATALIKTGTKLAVGVGAVYVTLDQGVWNTSTEGSKALDRVRTKVLPATNDYINKVPSVDQLGNTVTDKWNSGVQVAFRGLSATPDTVANYSKLAVDEVKKSLKP